MKSKVIPTKEVGQIRHPVPKSLIDAVGMLKGKFGDGVKYQQKIRREWEKRFERQISLGSPPK